MSRKLTAEWSLYTKINYWTM